MWYNAARVGIKHDTRGGQDQPLVGREKYLLNKSGEVGMCADGKAVRTHPHPQITEKV